jgi:hypothetical protein
MSRPTAALTDAAAEARAELAEEAHAGFDRLAHALLSSAGAARQPALGAVLRGQLPGTAGVRWLHAEGLAPTARATDLTAAQWLSLHTAWLANDRAPRSGGRPAGRTGRADSRHGHAPGAQAAPRWF